MASEQTSDPNILDFSDPQEEYVRLRNVLREVRRDIEETADDVVWMRGGIETVCDRITAALEDQEDD